MNTNLSENHSLRSTSVPSQPPAVEEDEGGDEEPTAELTKTVDEPEDEKEEYDEDGDAEKAAVEVIQPVPEPEDEAPKTEPTGQRLSLVIAFYTHSPSVSVRLCAWWFQGVPVCTRRRPKRSSPRLRTQKV